MNHLRFFVIQKYKSKKKKKKWSVCVLLNVLEMRFGWIFFFLPSTSHSTTWHLFDAINHSNCSKCGNWDSFLFLFNSSVEKTVFHKIYIITKMEVFHKCSNGVLLKEETKNKIAHFLIYYVNRYIALCSFIFKYILIFCSCDIFIFATKKKLSVNV